MARKRPRAKAGDAAWLYAQRRELVDQEEQAHRELLEAEEADGPFRRAFWEAHSVLAATYATQLKIGPHDKAELFAAYDARMLAGHAWNPHKQRLRDAERWHKAVLAELRYVNEALSD